MSKMAMSYVILAVCITFQAAQAGTLSDLANSLSLQNVPSKLNQGLTHGLKLAHDGVNSAIEQSKHTIDQTIAELSHERDQIQNERNSLLKDARNAKPCDKLTDTLKANMYLMYESSYNCVLKGLESAKSENANIANVSNALLDIMGQKLPELAKCEKRSDMLSTLLCLLSNTALETTSLAPLFGKLFTLLPEYFTILLNTAGCIGLAWPKSLLDKNLPEDLELCARSYAQSLICDKKQPNLHMY